jgi:hypothetical protein
MMDTKVPRILPDRSRVNQSLQQNRSIHPHPGDNSGLVLLEPACRFIWELHCGRKNRKLFKRAMWTLVKMINTTGDLALITDGERR